MEMSFYILLKYFLTDKSNQTAEQNAMLILCEKKKLMFFMEGSKIYDKIMFISYFPAFHYDEN